MELNKNLPNKRRYVKLEKNNKKPTLNDWPNPKHCLDKKQAVEWLKQGYNIGFRLGDGYVGVDCDSIELELAMEGLIKTPTYTQKSAKRGMKHFIFKIKDFNHNLALKNKGNNVGEILCLGRQMVLAPSKIDNKYYEVLNDISIAEITKKELMTVILEFESKITQRIRQETKQFYKKSDIDDLNITSVLPTAGMKQDNQGRYWGSNPFHSSTTGHNFWITPSKNLAYCFRCDCAISPAKAIALREGIISNCNDSLRGNDFIKTVKIGKEKYGIGKENKDKEKKILKFWTYRDYESYREPKNHIIKGFLYEGEIVMIYAPSGKFKSIEELFQAVCISSGRKYLGKYPTRQMPVAILSAENSIKTDKERLIAIRKGLGVRKKDTKLYILSRHECEDILNPSFRESLFNFLDEKKIKVLFLDTINPLSPEIDDIKTKDVVRLFNEFLKPVAEKGISVCFLQHTDKQEKSYLGSVKYKGSADVVRRIEREELESEFKIYNEKNRHGEANTLTIRFDFINNNNTLKEIRAVLIDDTAKPEIFKKKRKPSKTFKLKNEILTTLPENQEMTRKEIIELFEGDNSSVTIDRALKELVADSKLKYVSKGVYIK
jgi:RecA-family ATPase